MKPSELKKLKAGDTVYEADRSYDHDRRRWTPYRIVAREIERIGKPTHHVYFPERVFLKGREIPRRPKPDLGMSIDGFARRFSTTPGAAWKRLSRTLRRLARFHQRSAVREQREALRAEAAAARALARAKR